MTNLTTRALAILENGYIQTEDQSLSILSVITGYNGEILFLGENNTIPITYLGSDIVDIDLESEFYVKLIFVEIEGTQYMLEYLESVINGESVTEHNETTKIAEYKPATYKELE